MVVRLLLDKTRYLIISVSNPRLTEASWVRHGSLVTQFPARDPILMDVPLELRRPRVVASPLSVISLYEKKGKKKERVTTRPSDL